MKKINKILKRIAYWDITEGLPDDEPPKEYYDLHFNETWLAESIEYHQKALRENADLSVKEIDYMLNDIDYDNNNYYYCYEEGNGFPEYWVYVEFDSHGADVYIQAIGYCSEIEYSRSYGEYEVDYKNEMEVKYSREEFLNKNLNSIIQDLQASEELKAV